MYYRKSRKQVSVWEVLELKKKIMLKWLLSKQGICLILMVQCIDRNGLFGKRYCLYLPSDFVSLRKTVLCGVSR